VKERKTELDEARKELKQVKGQIITGKLKGSLVNTVTNVTDKVGSMFNDTKAKKFQEEIQALQSQNETLHSDICNLQEDFRNM
jgi:predicted  nucleic acid-binding Zn-ribbon protein